MSFTNDDLKRLKLQINNLLAQEPAPLINIDFKICLALLARLEAAENALVDPKDMDECGFCVGGDDEEFFHAKDCELVKTYEAWRKAAGK